MAITATDQDTGRVMTRASPMNAANTECANVPPGKYTIQAELSGFSTVS